MARIPKVYFYTPKDQYVNLSGIGNPGDYITRFSYKYSETSDDKCQAILGFTRTNIDLTFLQPGIAYHLRWGYVGEKLSNVRKVVVKKAVYKYTSTGFTVTLDMVPVAAYKGEATIRDPNGDSLVDTLIDGAKEVGQTGFVYTTTSGQKLQVIKKKEGGWKHQEFDASGKEVKTQLTAAEKFKVNPSVTKRVVAADWQEHYAKQSLTMVGGLGPSASFAKPATVPVSSLKGLVSYQDVFKGLAQMYQANGVNMILKIRDDAAISEPIDWGSSPIFGVVANAGVISWIAEKMDKEDKLVGRQAATIDPLTKTIESVNVTVEKPFTVKYQDAHSKTLVKVKVYQKGDDYYMKPVDGGKTSETQILKSLYDKLKDQNVEAQLLRNRGYSQSDIDKLVSEDKLKKGYNKHLDEAFASEKDKKAKTLYEAWGLSNGAVKAGYVKPLYSGDTAEQLTNKAIQQTLNQLFYNLKVTIVTEGNPQVEDQVNFTFVAGNPDIDYIYHLDESEHIISSTGYTTKLVGYKVAPSVERITRRVKTQVEEGLAAKFPDIKTDKALIDGIRELNLELGATLTTLGKAIYHPSLDENSHTLYSQPFGDQPYQGSPYVDLRIHASKLINEKWDNAVAAEKDHTKSFSPDQTIEEALKEYNNTPKNE